MMSKQRQFGRREFIVTTIAGGLAIGFRIPPGDDLPAAIGNKPWEPLASASDVELNAWLVITPDDDVIIRVAQSEMGQGTFTSWAKMIAEELHCDWSKVRTEYASANRHFRENEVYGRMGTYSSSSVRLSRRYLQQAGASARERLIAAAAQQWGVDRSVLKAENGVVVHTPTGQRLRFGQLVEKAATIQLKTEPEIKTPDQFTLMNRPTKLLETPLRVNGTATYGIDIRLPGMLYGAVKACPVFYGKVKSYEFDAIKDLPGVHSAVAFGIANNPEGLFHGKPLEDGVAVIADSYWRAKTALEALPIEWEPGEHGNANSEGFFKMARAALEEPGTAVVDKGDVLGAMNGASQVVEAVYELPYLDHALMEPLNCTVQITPDRVDVWGGSQQPDGSLLAVAQMTGVPRERVFFHNTFLGGGFGRRTYSDEIMQAVLIAQQVNANRPIKIIWSREETTQHGAYRPMRVAKFQAGLGPAGLPLAYFNRIIGIDWPPTEGYHEQATRGLHEVPYAIPNQLVDFHLLNTHVPTGVFTSVGRSQNVFFLESFIDEMAHAAGRDPYEYRRQLLEANPDFRQRKRWVQALDVAAQKSGWGKSFLPSGTGLGMGIDDSRRPSRPQIGICAVVARVSVSRPGKVTVERVDVAFDTGPFLVNPLIVERQIEMQVATALGMALHQEITIEKGRVVQSNFHDHPLLPMREMPEVAIHFLKTSEEEIVGVGEELIGIVAPAVCNAIFAATGKRIRSLPLRKHDISWS